MKGRRPPLEVWLDDIKSDSTSPQIGVFFTHNGVVRATSRDGSAVAGMEVSCDSRRLERVDQRRSRPCPGWSAPGPGSMRAPCGGRRHRLGAGCG